MDGAQSAATEDTVVLGTVAVLRRYPVKSMLGEELVEAEFTGGGVTGDRAPVLLDVETGRVAHAVRAVLAQNRVDIPGSGLLPCAGLYCEVLAGGMIRAGETVLLH